MKVNIAPSVSAAVALGVLSVVAADFNPIVPLASIEPGDAASIETMRTLRRTYGIRRFLFGPPGVRLPLGAVDATTYVKAGESFAAARAALKGTDIELLWFVRPVIGWDPDAPGQHIVDCEGHVSTAWCPLNREAEERFLRNFRDLVRIGRPHACVIEDDYNLSGHAGLANRHGGCFCPLHLAALARKTGKTLSAAELGAAFDAPTPANEPLRRAFAEVSRESLAGLAGRIRAALDEIDPSVRMILCQSGQVDIDGDTTEANTRAFAGGTRPGVRIYGAAYFSQNVPQDLPMATAHTFYSAQHLPPDIERFYEADSFPNTRFYNSSRFYASEMAAAMMAGASDMLLFCGVRMSGGKPVDPAYLDVFRANGPRFAAVRDFRSRSSLVGVRAVYDPEAMYMTRTRGTGTLGECARVLAKFGLPMTTLPSGASVLFGDAARHLSEAKLREVLRGAVIVDSTAALCLQARGLGGWLGCRVEPADGTLAFSCARALPVPGQRVTGAISHYHILEPVTPVPGWDMKMDYVRITPGARTETWIRYEMPDGKVVAPSFVVSTNALGGTVGVMSFAVAGNFREWLYNRHLQDAFRNFFDRATPGGIDVVATRTPGVWLSAAVSADGRELLVMANNLAGEPRDDVRLEFSRRWRGGAVERLQADGTWKRCGTADGAFVPDGGLTYDYMVPEFFRITKEIL